MSCVSCQKQSNAQAKLLPWQPWERQKRRKHEARELKRKPGRNKTAVSAAEKMGWMGVPSWRAHAPFGLSLIDSSSAAELWHKPLHAGASLCLCVKEEAP